MTVINNDRMDDIKHSKSKYERHVNHPSVWNVDYQSATNQANPQEDNKRCD